MTVQKAMSVANAWLVLDQDNIVAIRFGHREAVSLCQGMNACKCEACERSCDWPIARLKTEPPTSVHFDDQP